MAILLLIRHGTNDMVGKRLAGRLPEVHLNDEGRQQAQDLAQLLKKLPVRAIYSSPLERAVETAQPLADQLNLSVQIHPGLLEVDFGAWSGNTVDEMQSQELWKTVQENPSRVRFPGGEAVSEAQRRVVDALDGLNRQYAAEDMVACFSHCDTLRLAVAYYLNIPLDDFQRLSLDTASVSILFLNEGKPKLLCLNQTTSLENLKQYKKYFN